MPGLVPGRAAAQMVQKGAGSLGRVRASIRVRGGRRARRMAGDLLLEFGEDYKRYNAEVQP